MKKITFLLLLISGVALGQKIDGAYVKALYAKYPAVKSNFCPACKLWVNPYYKSIADTQRHFPLVEYELLTKSHYALTASLKLPRTGIYAAWHPVTGQPNEDNVYKAANKAGKGVIAKGHINAWILNAWCADAAILSDTYTFNAALEMQNQNVGTEIATENITRKLLANEDVEIWGGTFGSEANYTDGKITDTQPAYYWKVIKEGNGTVTCYWMPNLQTETQAMLSKRIVTYQQLVKNLGFDPSKILN
jgi:DNA/RNA endonuclease G (NUC1)